MSKRSQKQANIIAGWLTEILGYQFYGDTMEIDGGNWFHADELYRHLNGNRDCCNILNAHVQYTIHEDEYFLCDFERHPSVYVNGMGAIKMLHNVISPVTIKIFKRIGLNHIKKIIDSGRLITA